MPTWNNDREEPGLPGHLVQFYAPAEHAFAANVGIYLREGLERGDGLLVIATPQNSEAFRIEIAKHNADPKALIQDGHLLFLDAHETLERFMEQGKPNWPLFESVIGAAVRRVRPHNQGGGLRAYGEMVDLLWRARKYMATIRLEHYWNLLLAKSPFSLFCGYAIDVFGKDFEIASLDALLCAHCHMLPATDGNLEIAINRAMEESFGPLAGELKSLVTANFHPAWAGMPLGEAMALGIRENIPRQADVVLQSARRHYEAIQHGLNDSSRVLLIN